jgi:long-chain acyl-CoA synthetase
MNTVPQNLSEAKPTIACAVPRFFEKMYARIQEEVNKGSALKRAIFKWAVQVGSESSQFRIQKKPMSPWLRFQYQLAGFLVYRKIYRKLGGRLRCFISGSAPLAKELAEFFYSVGILILEGYGLTETSPVISVNCWESFKFGSVGLPMKHVEVKIASDGEIVVRGPSVMQGYYRNQEAASEAIRDGWFYTGDFGRLDSDGFLYITGRKKDLIKTSGGKFVSPQNIEGLLSSEPLISQIVVVGDKQRFITALIVPNFEPLKAALKLEAEVNSPQELVQDKRVHDLIRLRIDVHTKELASYEKIKFFTLLTKEFSQSEGELTTTLKIKRNVIAEHFKDVISRMYTETENQNDEGRDRIFYVV